MFSRKYALAATTALVCAAAATGAFAQATGTNTVQELVVTGKQTKAVGGIVSQQEAPKTREVVDRDYIATQPVGMTVLSDLNFVPGINYTQDDPYGMSGSGGHLSIRGIKGAAIGEMVDGVPLNDAGNYAIYPGELVDPEVIASVNVITGSTDPDAPLSSSLGGQVDINTLTPTDQFGGFVNASAGSFDFGRLAFVVNTGEVGPFGTKMWIEGSETQYHKFDNGPGSYRKKQANAKIYQDLHHEGDFIAVAGFFDDQTYAFYDGVNFASTGVTSGNNYHPVTTSGYNYHGLLATPWNTDYNSTYVPYTLGSTPPSANSAFYGVEQNPTKTGNIRGESKFTLLPNLRLTIDPSYQWVLANGGGSTVISESDPRLTGLFLQKSPLPAIGGLTSNKSNFPACTNSSGVITGLDLDGNTSGGNPVCTDSVRLASPSNTQTNRYTVNTSLIWDLNPRNIVQFTYAYDHANVRQTGEYGLIDNTTGWSEGLWGGLQTYGTPIIAADGTIFQKRNRTTIAVLNNVAVEYIGKWFGDHLRLDLGVRDPFLSRDLNQYCYTQPPANVYCTSNSQIAAAQSGGGYTVAPFKIHTSYDKLLPNVGFTWNFDHANSVFVDYTQAMNAPVNDDLYSIAAIGSGTTASGIGVDNVQPETTTTYELGYRYQTSRIRGTLDVFKIEDANHIVTSYDNSTGDSVDQNLGTINFWGVEGLIGASITRNWKVVGTFTYEHSEVMNDIPYSYNTTTKVTTYVPTQGKQYYDTPKWMFGGRTTYDLGDFTFGLQAKYVGQRFVTYVNDLSVPAYFVTDADVRWRVPALLPKGSYLQLNVLNLFDKKYISSINANDYSNNGSLPYYSYGYAYQGAPRTIQGTLHLTF